MNGIKVVDLFCGAGGFSQGFENFFEIALANDIEKDMIKTFQENHPNTLALAEDIKKVDFLNLLKKEKLETSEIKGVIGGPPCQGFSLVGNRIIDDPRNKLFKEFVKIVFMVKPAFFLMENVKGMLSAKNGIGEPVVEEIKKDFEDVGYKVSYSLLNALNYGVPQKRERLFFLGYKKELNLVPSFPEATHKGNGINITLANLSAPLTVKDAISDLPELGDSLTSTEKYTIPEQNDYQKKMREGSNKIHNHTAPNHKEYMLERIKRVPEGGNHLDLPEEYKLKSGYPNIYGRLSWNKHADTITANCGCVSAPGRFIHPKQHRAITVREAARLQSFKDKFVFYGSKNSQYKQAGNAVPPLLSEALAKKIYEQIKPIYSKNL